MSQNVDTVVSPLKYNSQKSCQIFDLLLLNLSAIAQSGLTSFYVRAIVKKVKGSGCGAVGRAVASDIRGPGFESSHWQLLLNIYLLLTVCRKDENKEKEAGNGPFL